MKAVTATVGFDPDNPAHCSCPTSLDVTLLGLSGESVPLPPSAQPANDFELEGDPVASFTVWVDGMDATVVYFVFPNDPAAPNDGIVARVNLSSVWEALAANLPQLQSAARFMLGEGTLPAGWSPDA